MQNEFEKQVQQKMEELKLVPSDPVWEKVEMQIRKKKDRRRVIFWIPLFAFIGAGLWLGVDQYSNNTSHNETNNKTQKQNPVAVPEPATINKTIEEKEQTISHTSVPLKQIHSEIRDVNPSEISLNWQAARKNRSEKVNRSNPVSFTEKKQDPSEVGKTVFGETEIIKETPEQVTEKKNFPDTSLSIVQNSDTISTVKEKTGTKATSVPVKQDSASIKQPVPKKHVVSKWKYHFVALAGTSGLGRINMHGGEKSLAYYTPSSGVGLGSSNSGGGSSFTNYSPSEVEKGFSFAVGAAIEKSLAKRIFFSAGLQYNYYSNTIKVGSKVNQNRVIMDFAVTQYYSGQGSPLQPYKNQYHFISLPVDINWQLMKKRPLNFSTGLSLQYLIESNALVYDYKTPAYFHDIHAFNRTQLISQFGLTYSVSLQQKPLTFGPQFQYGLSGLEKENSEHHLFFYGLKVQWQIKK